MVGTHFCPHGISLEVPPGDRRAGNALSALSWLSSVCRSGLHSPLSYLFLKRHHQSSVRTRQSQARLLRLASRCLSTRGRSFWCGWDTQISGQHGCCVPKGVPRAFETLKKYICFVQNASLSSSFYIKKTQRPMKTTETRSQK